MSDDLHIQDLVAEDFRLHILRFWSRERQIKFCLHILGDEAQEWWKNKKHATPKNSEVCPYCEGAKCCEYRDGTSECVSCMGTGKRQ